jgi:hypothetical protein
MTRSLTRFSGFENLLPGENVNVPVDKSQTQAVELCSPLTTCENRKDNRFVNKGRDFRSNFEKRRNDPFVIQG